MRFLFLVLTLITVPLSAQLTGTWNGTYTLTHTTCPGAFTGPAALYARQSDGTFVAVLDIDAVSNETCSVTGMPLALPISGSVSGNNISAMIFGPFENQSAAFIGTVAGNTMTASFADIGTSVTVTLTRSSSDPPAAAITGTYSGTYSVTDTLTLDPCANVPSLSYSGPLTATVLQGGPLVSAIIHLTELKDTDHDESGNCTIIDGEDERVGLMGTITGNTISGVIFSDITFPATATVSGETISGSASSQGISITFSMTRTSLALVPAVLEFGADPATVLLGSSTTLRWTVFNAATVTIDHGVGTKPAVGTVLISPVATTTYTLTAISSTGTTTTAQTTVTVQAAETLAILTFTATPEVIGIGACSTLSWTTANATSVSIDNGVGSRPVNGSTSVCPAATTNYTLTATGEGGSATRSAAVIVMTHPHVRRRAVRH